MLFVTFADPEKRFPVHLFKGTILTYELQVLLLLVMPDYHIVGTFRKSPDVHFLYATFKCCFHAPPQGLEPRIKHPECLVLPITLQGKEKTSYA